MVTHEQNEEAIRRALTEGFYIDDSDGYGAPSFFNDEDDTPKWKPNDTHEATTGLPRPLDAPCGPESPARRVGRSSH